MLSNVGYQVITASSSLYEVPNTSNSGSSSESIGVLIGIIVGAVVLIIFLIILIIHCVKKRPVEEDIEEYSHQEKEVPIDSIILSN
jgi:Ca2+/Na+ antiporter